MFEIKVIGNVQSSLKDLKDCPLQEHEQAPKAMIRILPEYAAGVGDIRTGDTIVLLTWLNLADRSVLATHPRNDPQSKLTGVFSTRSPDRPNPIGLHIVKVTAVTPDNGFEVSSLEVLDQTPVIDIKPYIL